MPLDFLYSIRLAGTAVPSRCRREKKMYKFDSLQYQRVNASATSLVNVLSGFCRTIPHLSLSTGL